MPRQKNYKHRQKKQGRVLKKLALFFLFCFMAIAIAGAGLFLYIIRDLPDPSKINDRKVSESTKIYDRTGKVLLYEIHGEEKRTIVKSDQISQHLKDATIVAEDFSFYEHGGIDYKSIIRAFLIDIYRGQLSRGGATITQQLIKNSFLSTEKTFTRKIKEIILAIKIDKQYSKEEILELYLNQIPYGSNAYGAESAAQTFFNKKASELTVNEAALLAALPKAPSYYSPYGQNKEELTARKNAILERMRKVGFVGKDEFEKAKSEQLVFAKQKGGIKAPHVAMYVKDYLEKRYGADVAENGGLRVVTTLDYDLQKTAEEVVEKYGEINEKKYKARNSALTAVDPKTGQLLAMVGSRDYFNIENDGNFNVATSKNRQPGSSFKPFAYAVFFQKGYSPDMALFDVKTEFSTNPDEPYSPDNYDDKFRGPVSAKSALAQSLNIPAVKVLYLAGIEDTIALAKAMGITTLEERNRFGLSLVLGGGEVRPIDMAYAYSVFANDGVKNDESFILEVKNSKNEILEKWRLKQKEVLPKNIARAISAILSDNSLRAPVFGEQSPLFFDNYQVAAKTGTTQKYRDAWVAGYTPTLSVSVWTGNNDGAPMEKGGAGVAASGPMFHEFMEKALSARGSENFTPPEPILISNPSLNGEYAGETKVKIDKDSGKLVTAKTPPQKIEERVFKEIHTVLYYINKDDPQYQSWESAIQKWLTDNPIFSDTQSKAPTEYDDIHTNENKPILTILNPQNYSAVPESGLSVKISATGQFPIKEVDFFANNMLVSSDFSYPYETNLDLSGAESGEVVIIARSYDKYDNVGEVSVLVFKKYI